jgi:single stranded DNA-binding protein
MNQIIIEGNLGSDPEMKMFKDETLASFSLAHTPRSKVNNQWEDGETVWFRVTFWNSKSDSVLENLKKGDKVMVVGKLSQSNYTNKAGESKNSLEISGTSFYIIPKSPYKGAPVVRSVDEFLNEMPVKDLPSW